MGEVIRFVRNGRFIGWYLRFYDADGRRRQMASKQPTQAEARKMLLQIEARIARGEAGIAERRAWPTVAELVETFLAEYSRPRIKDIEKYRAGCRGCLLKVLPFIGKRLTAHVTDEDIAHLRDVLLRTRQPGTVKNTLAALSTMFVWGMRKKLATHNPCKGVERPICEPAIDFLTREEVARLLAVAAESSMLQHVAIALAVHTGLRKGELFGLRWQDIDIDTRRLTVARSYAGTPKSGKARHLRLPVELVPLLRQWRDECPPSPSGLVLPHGITASKMICIDALCGLPRLMRLAGIRRLLRPWHTLRHTFASHYMMSGGNILALQKILGHADLRITMLYAHLAPDFLADEMDKVKFK